MKRSSKTFAPVERIGRAARAIRALYDPVLAEPIPQRLRALAHRIGSIGKGRNVDPEPTDPTRRRKKDD